MAVSKYDKENLSQSDQNKIADLTAQATAGKITWADAHSQAESIRNAAGYSGGRYGDTYTSTTKSTGSSGASSGGNSTPSAGGSGTSSVYGVTDVGTGTKANSGTTYATNSQPNLSRNTNLANSIATSGGYTVFYDDNGYATKAVKGSADYTPTLDQNAKNGTYATSGAWTDNEMLTAADLQKIAEYRAGIGTKYTSDEANALANAIRSNYGYTIDKSGNVTDLLAKNTVDQRRQQWGLPTDDATEAQQNVINFLNGAAGQTTDLSSLLSALGQSDYSGSSAPTYSGSQWDDLLNQVAGELASMNYTDWTNSDQYQALADRYSQNGQMTMQNVLGQIASRTGGLASSYAATAAQQQYNELMSQLEDVARQMYDSERSEKLDNANLYRQLSQDDYDEYLNELSQWNTDRSFNYNAAQDAQNYQYQLDRDAVEDSRYADETAYSRDQTSKSDAQDRISSYLAAGGKAADLDADLVASSGYTTSELTALENYYASLAAQQTASTTKTSYSSGSGSSKGSSGGSSMTLTTAKEMAKAGEFTQEVLDKLHNAGYTDSYLKSAYGYEGDSSTGKSDTKETNSSGSKMTSLDYNEDEGIFRWNGKDYSSVDTLLEAISAANLTDNQLSTLKSKFKTYGFTLS